MVNIDNLVFIRDVIRRKGRCYVIPLYVNICGKRYGILEIPDLTLMNVTKSAFKVGFGTLNHCGMLNNITPSLNDDERKLLQYFSDVRMFTVFEESININVQYITFESDADTAAIIADDIKPYPFLSEIMLYYNALYDKVSDITSTNRKQMLSRLNEENIE